MRQSPEQRAQARFDKEESYIDFHNHHGYLACIREEVEPRDREVERLRALVQAVCDNNATAEDARDALLDAQEMFKQAGFVPTNTEDNG